jgi:hypothetical protein
MFSLGAAGEAAVVSTHAAITFDSGTCLTDRLCLQLSLLEIMAKDDFDTATFAVHALADACQNPMLEAVTAVQGLIDRALAAIAEREQAMADKWSGVSDSHAVSTHAICPPPNLNILISGIFLSSE